MTATELFPALRNLPHDEKIKAMKFLEEELRKAEEAQQLLELLQPGVTYEIWSPCTTHEAAWQLAEMLEKHQQND